MQNFVRFHTTEYEIELLQKFWKKRNSSTPYKATRTQIASLLFLMIYILYVNFCAISFRGKEDWHIPKISEKVSLQRYQLRDFHLKLIDTN